MIGARAAGPFAVVAQARRVAVEYVARVYSSVGRAADS